MIRLPVGEKKIMHALFSWVEVGGGGTCLREMGQLQNEKPKEVEYNRKED